MLIATGLGASLALALVVACTHYLGGARPLAANIAMRILGSWIAASAILVLALRFARGLMF